MDELLLVTLGAVLASGLNLATSWYTRRQERRVVVGAAARRLYYDLLHHGRLEINDLAQAKSVDRLVTTWADTRDLLVDLGAAQWRAIVEGVVATIEPDLMEPRPMDSHNARLEAALVALEPRANPPSELRSFGIDG